MKRKRGTVRKTRYEDFPALDLDTVNNGDLLWFWNDQGYRRVVKFIRSARSREQHKRAVIGIYNPKTGWENVLVDTRLLTKKVE